MYETDEQRRFRIKSYIGISLVGILIWTLSILSSYWTEKRIKECRYFPAKEMYTYTYCMTSSVPVWEKMKDIEKERSKLFEAAQRGSQNAKRKLNKLNYEEQLRKQKYRSTNAK